MRIIYNLILFISIFFSTVVTVFALSFPKPTGLVNDFAGLYSSSFRSQLEGNLGNFEKENSAEIAVVTINSLEREDIDDYAVRLFEDWKIGKKGKDNGILILIAKNDRKMRIEVGYGLEPYITDGRAGEIIRNQMAPEFKKNDYEKGTLQAVESIKKYISDQDVGPPQAENKKSNIDSSVILFAIGFIYFIISYLASYFGRTKEIWPGGLIGGILGAIGGLFVASIIGVVIGGILFGSFGLLFDYILTKNYQKRKSRGLPTGFWHTWGGFGGSSSSSGSSGGFGGFGGGSSGGGGSRGSW